MRQLALIGAVVMVFVIIAGVAILSQRFGSEAPTSTPTKQYTVQKSRSSARGLASSDRKVEGTTGVSDTTIPVQSLTPDAEPKTTRIIVPVKSDVPPLTNSEESESSAESIIAESYSAEDPQSAMDLLIKALIDAQAPDDASKLYAAIGSLQLAQENPDKEAGLTALRNATDSAETPAMRTQAALTEASALLVHAESEDGLARIDELLADDSLEAECVHHLTLLRGDLLVEHGDLREAESVYEGVRAAVSPTGALANDDLYRQASLRLSRLYARTGDDKKGALIARDLKRATTPAR